MEETKIPRCLFSLHRKCVVLEKLLEQLPEDKAKELLQKWGSDEWIKLYCAMCVKALYARAKFKAVQRYSVVNTL